MPSPNADYDPKKYWTDVAKRIDERESGSFLAGDDEPSHRYKRERFLRTLFSNVDVTDLDCLEIGMGPGGNLIELAGRRPRRLVGCDLSSAMVDLASRNTADLPVDIVQLEGGPLPFSDNEFDLAYTVTVLQHNVDAVAYGLLDEMCRVSRGKVILFEETKMWRSEKYSFVWRSPSEYIAVAEKNGFTCVENRRMNMVLTETSCALARKVFNLRGVEEGQSRSPLSTHAEDICIALTGHLNWLAPPVFGLTKLVFQPS